MKLCDVVSLIEKRVPLAWSEEWDNSGLLVGDPDSEIQKIGIALDATEDTVLTSTNLGCQLLVSHHPIIFRPLKNIIPDRPAGKAMVMAIKKGLSLYAAHTNWDSSPEGVNFTLAELLGLDDIEPLIPPADRSSSWGMGAVGEFMMPMPFETVMKLIKERWSLSSCTGYGSKAAMVKRIAIGGGSCGDMWEQAGEKSASLFVTADMSYHNRQDALNSGLKLIDVDHGEMERASLPKLKSLIEKETGLIVEMIPETERKKFIL
ncbi:MAG: Nif3-like dinuclear metal center hexameric protein [Synergistaceae bacterium]|nr:Nif3-like dinuclear metal center hexameric protein [Synergistaceae bacterium]